MCEPNDSVFAAPTVLKIQQEMSGNEYGALGDDNEGERGLLEGLVAILPLSSTCRSP